MACRTPAPRKARRRSSARFRSELTGQENAGSAASTGSAVARDPARAPEAPDYGPPEQATAFSSSPRYWLRRTASKAAPPISQARATLSGSQTMTEPSSPVVAKRSPSGCTAMRQLAPSWPCQASVKRRPLRASHRCSAPLRSTATRVTPSAKNARSVAPPVWPVNDPRCSPVAMSHKSTTSSLDAVASSWPSGLKATLHTTSVSAAISRVTSALSRFHSLTRPSVVATASVAPSGESAARVMLPPSFRSSATRAPVATSQRRTSRSLAVTSRLPSGVNARDQIALSCAAMVLSSAPSAGFHSRTSPLRSPDASIEPFGENARAQTWFLCPVSTIGSQLLPSSHISTAPVSSPAARRRPSALIATPFAARPATCRTSSRGYLLPNRHSLICWSLPRVATSLPSRLEPTSMMGWLWPLAVAADQVRAIRRERDPRNVAGVPERLPDDAPARIGEHDRGAVAAVGGEPISLGAEGEPPDVARMRPAHRLEQRFPGGQFPAVDLALAIAGHEAAPVRTERHPEKVAGAVDQRAADRGSLRDIPEPNRPVFPGRGQRRAVGTETHAPQHFARIPELAVARLLAEVPELELAVVAHRRELSPVGREIQILDTAAVRAQAWADPLARRGIDEVDASIPLAHRQQGTVGADRDGERVAGRNGAAEHDGTAANQQLPGRNHGGAGVVSRRSRLTALGCLGREGQGQERIVIHQALGHRTQRAGESLARLDGCGHGALFILPGLAKRHEGQPRSGGGARGEEGKSRDRQAADMARPPLLLRRDRLRLGLGRGRRIEKGPVEHAELTRVLRRPFERRQQGRAAIEEIGIAPLLVPFHRRVADALPRAQVVAVGLDPGMETRPGMEQGLMGDLDRCIVDGQEAGLRKGLHDTTHHVGLVMLDLAAIEGPPRVRGSLAGRDETQEQALRRLLLGAIEAVLEGRICGLADGAGDAAGRAESVQRQAVPLPPHPGLDEGVRDQRQRAGVAASLGEDGIHQVALQIEAGAARGLGDGAAELRIGHRPDQHLV